MRRFVPSPLRVITRALALGLAALVVSGVGHLITHPARVESPEASLLVTSLSEDHATSDLIPSGFSEELGYAPAPVGATLTNPNGGCSTPGGVGPAHFSPACRAHDLGYDTLRYAESEGERLGPWARLDLDIRLYEDLLATCETAPCSATATVYFTAVTVNSIRQGYQAPTEEPTAPWVGLAVGIVGVAVFTPPMRWEPSGHKSGHRTEPGSRLEAG